MTTKLSHLTLEVPEHESGMQWAIDKGILKPPEVCKLCGEILKRSEKSTTRYIYLQVYKRSVPRFLDMHDQAFGVYYERPSSPERCDICTTDRVFELKVQK